MCRTQSFWRWRCLKKCILSDEARRQNWHRHDAYLPHCNRYKCKMTHYDFAPSTTDASPDLLVKSAENTRVSPKSPISLDFFGSYRLKKSYFLRSTNPVENYRLQAVADKQMYGIRCLESTFKKILKTQSLCWIALSRLGTLSHLETKIN